MSRPLAVAFRDDPNDPRHGTYNGYSNLGCRCAGCRAANVVENRKARQRRKAQIDPDDPRHGTAQFYQNYSCRCRPCTDAHSAENLANKRRKRYLGYINADGQHWPPGSEPIIPPDGCGPAWHGGRTPEDIFGPPCPGSKT